MSFKGQDLKLSIYFERPYGVLSGHLRQECGTESKDKSQNSTAPQHFIAEMFLKFISSNPVHPYLVASINNLIPWKKKINSIFTSNKAGSAWRPVHPTS